MMRERPVDKPLVSLSPPKRGEGQGEEILIKKCPPHPGPLPRFAAEREKFVEILPHSLSSA